MNCPLPHNAYISSNLPQARQGHLTTGTKAGRMARGPLLAMKNDNKKNKNNTKKVRPRK